MNRRPVLLAISFVLAWVFVLVVLAIGKVDFRLTVQRLEDVHPIRFVGLLLLNVGMVVVSTEKWRSIDVALRTSSDSPQPRFTSFALTSTGLALGILLPIQVAMSTARSLGTYVHGSPLKRGTAGTLFEQAFDLFVVGLLAVASVITWAVKGGALVWFLLAATLTAVALASAKPLSATVRRMLIRLATRTQHRTGRISNFVNALSRSHSSDLLHADLAVRLIVLSAVRFVIMILMLVQTAAAVDLRIPFWEMAAATPFVVIASIIAVTPGGIGVNELTAAACLAAFGTPLRVGAQWSIANRVLVTVSYLCVAGFSASVLFFLRFLNAERGLKVR